MGVGMQIAYLGFAGTVQIEGEAGAQLVRFARFSRRISNCRLVIEASVATGRPLYEARLDLITRGDKCISIAHCSDEDPEAALRAAFDLAEQALEDGGGRITDTTP